MKKIYILVIKAYLGPLVMTFFIAMFILLMQFLWKYVDDLVGKGLEWYVITELMFYASSTFVPLALPLAILLSSLMTFGNLGEHYELVAIKAAGISLRRVMFPLLVLSVIISILAFYFSNNLLPVANLKFRSILYDVRKQKLALNIKEGVFYDGIDGYVIRVGKKEKDGQTVRNIKIYDHTAMRGNTNLTIAEWGTMKLTADKKFLLFNLFNGYNYNEKTDQGSYQQDRQFQRTQFREESRRFDLSSFAMNRSDEDMHRSHYLMLNLKQLRSYEDSIRKTILQKQKNIAGNLSGATYFLDQQYKGPPAHDTAKALTSNFLDNFDADQHDRIAESALNSARNFNQFIIMQRDEIAKKNKALYLYQIEIQRKFTLSFACFVLFLIGAPLGAIIRKGGFGTPMVFTVIFFVLFHVISTTGEKFAREGVLPAWEGMWISSLVFLPIGIFLTYKATTDSPLLDAESWKKFTSRLSLKNIKANTS